MVTTFLYAEDNDLNFYLIERFVDLFPNYAVKRVINGEEAVKLYKQERDSIDVILMDMNMPVMNGVDATKQIRAFDKDVPIICSSAYPIDYFTADQRSLFTDYLPKPVDSDSFKQIMDKYSL